MTLESCCVVIMRPIDQAQSLVDYVQAHHGDVILLPMLTIEPRRLLESQKSSIQQAEYIVVTSQNAVRHLTTAEITLMQSSVAKWVCIGQTTAQALNQHHIISDYVGNKGSSSETLLAGSVLSASNVQGKSVVLLVGEGGRTLLATELAKRGAHVTSIYSYAQRLVPQPMSSFLEDWQKRSNRYCFVVTSVNILHHFMNQIEPIYLEWVLAQPIIVISERIEALAKKYGYQHIINARSLELDDMAPALDTACKL